MVGLPKPGDIQKMLDGFHRNSAPSAHCLRSCLNWSAYGSSVTRRRDVGFALTVEARPRQGLSNYAVELRQLAYTLPSGVDENDLLRLSERMRAAAD